MKPVASTLFLHGGPGLCALPERSLYGDSLPINWWDQPRELALLRQPFEALLDASENALLRMADSTGVKPHIVAHSFGANIAHQLALRVPGRISSITLLAPAHDLSDSFVRLAQVVAAHAPEPAPLQRSLTRYMAERQSFSCYMDLVHHTLSVPNFLNAYWSPGAFERREWFARLMLAMPIFDLDTFTAVVRDYWTVGRMPSMSRFEGPVWILYGNADPLIDAYSSLAAWRHGFKHVSAEVIHSGHMMHLETDPCTWWRHSSVPATS